MAGGRWLVAIGSPERFFFYLGTVTDSVYATAKASAQSTSSSSICRLARASTGEGPCSFHPSSQSAACLDCPAMFAGTLIINGLLRDPRHRSWSKLPTYLTIRQTVGQQHAQTISSRVLQQMERAQQCQKRGQWQT